MLWLTVQERFFQPGREGIEAGLDSADGVVPTGRKERRNRKWAEAATHLRRTPGYSCSTDLPTKGSTVALISATSWGPSIQTQHRARSWSIAAKASPGAGHGEEVVLRSESNSFPSFSVSAPNISPFCFCLTLLRIDRFTNGWERTRKGEEGSRSIFFYFNVAYTSGTS